MSDTCVYETSLDKPCGRPATRPGPHCDFHSVLAAFEDEVSELPRIGSLLGLTTASMNRHEAIRQMDTYPGRYGE